MSWVQSVLPVPGFRAQIYLALPRMETQYRDWPDIVKKSLRDLSVSEKCWSTVRNSKYLNAYVGDSETPPESMVQLSVLLPMLEYADWSEEGIPIARDILATSPKFFDQDAKIYGRWLVSQAHKLDGIEAIAAFHEYLSYLDADGPEWLKILIPEFIRVLMYKGGFYYPPLLPEEMISQEPRTGEIEKKLWMPLEDIHDGWEQAGQVGQEMNGSGLPFGLVPRHYHHVNEGGFMIFVDYPALNYRNGEERMLPFDIFGDPRLSCRMRIMPKRKRDSRNGKE
jgi:hypothetical protein